MLDCIDGLSYILTELAGFAWLSCLMGLGCCFIVRTEEDYGKAVRTY